MFKEELNDAQLILESYIAQHRLRKTPERIELLAEIYRQEGHFTAAGLHASMSQKFPVSLATVYNNLELFIKLNLIVRHQFSHDIVEYERFTRNLTHHHRVCTGCGTVKEFSDMKIRRAVNNRTFSSFETSHFSLYIYGLCKKCQRKRKLKIK